MLTITSLGFPGSSMVKNPPATTQEMWVRSLGKEDALEEETASHSNILAWEIPWTANLAGYSPWAMKESEMAQRLGNNNSVYSFSIFPSTSLRVIDGVE